MRKAGDDTGLCAPSSRILSHHQVGVTILRDIVEEVLVPNIGQLAVVGRDLGEDGLRCYRANSEVKR